MTPVRWLAGGLVAAVVGACHHRPPPPPPAVVTVAMPTVPVESPWDTTMTHVLTAIDSGRYDAADSLLAAFERAEPAESDAAESAFWRTLLRVDPRNPAYAPATARSTLQRYLASGSIAHRVEASVLLGLLTNADSLRTVVASQRTAAEQRDRTRDEEMQKLRDELQRTQAELDRIKKRLAPPKP